MFDGGGYAMIRVGRSVALCCWLLVIGCSQQPTKHQATLQHVVIVWLKAEYQTPEYLQRLNAETAKLAKLPGVLALNQGAAIASERPMVDDSFDYAVLMTFASPEDMVAYTSHPLHRAFIRNFIAGKVTKLTIYDF